MSLFLPYYSSLTWGERSNFCKDKNSFLELEKAFMELKDREVKDREVKIKREIEQLF